MQRVAELLDAVVRPLEKEIVCLDDACGRFVARDILAPCSLPAVDEALRDGFAIRGKGERRGQQLCYPVVGEIAAGDLNVDRLKNDRAARIFTGAPVPDGTDRIVSQEHCRQIGTIVEIPSDVVLTAKTYIRRRGSELASGTLLVKRGECLRPHHLGVLATAGLARLELFRRPLVACYSTGSELVSVGSSTQPGQKISSNCLFLRHRLAQYGGRVVDYGLIEDKREALGMRLQDAVKRGVDLVVTTGGMGPGKYDLVAEDFIRVGGTIHCTSLPIRPGKSILVGTLGATLLLALPGPPTAVEVLADVLAGPVLYGMQGKQTPWPQPVEVTMATTICHSRPSGIDQLRPALCVLASGTCRLRTVTGPEESANCFLLFPGKKAELLQEELATVYFPPCDVC